MSKKMFDFSKFAKDAEHPGTKGSVVCHHCGGSGKIKGETCPNCKGTGKIPVWIPGKGDMATDPPVSEAQRRAMFAAKSGKSNIGIPKSVGAEFAKADPGGKLPERKR